MRKCGTITVFSTIKIYKLLHFEIGLEQLESKAFVAQYNPRRATQRRKPEIMTSVANQQFNTEKFNFAKINDSKELIFGLEFEQDSGQVL